MSNFTAYDDGLTFVHSFRVLTERHMQSRVTMNYADFSLIIPATVNGIFACELFLKSLFKNTVHGHELKDLLKDLEKEDQAMYNNIIRRCVSTLNACENIPKYDESVFFDELEKISNLFVELRYFYELGSCGKEYNLQFVGVFVDTLEVICKAKFGLRPFN